MENKKKPYNELSDSDQCDVCQDFQETHYTHHTIEDIDFALKSINPTVEFENGKITIWEAHRLQFEKILASKHPPPASPPSPAIEGREEDKDRIIDEWQLRYLDQQKIIETQRDIITRAERYLSEMKADDAHDPSVGLYRDTHLIQLVDDINNLGIPSAPPPSPAAEGEEHVHVRLPSGAVASVSPNASPELLDALDKMCEIAKTAKLPPTPPAGAEGDGEKKSVHPEDLKQVEKTIREALDTHLSIRGPGIPVAANHVSGKEKAANYLALWMTGFWGAMDEGAEQWRSDFMDATEKLSAAQAKIAELQARVNELQEWHDSHL